MNSKYLSWMQPFSRLCDVTKLKLDMQRLNLKGSHKHFVLTLKAPIISTVDDIFF